MNTPLPNGIINYPILRYFKHLTTIFISISHFQFALAEMLPATPAPVQNDILDDDDDEPLNEDDDDDDLDDVGQGEDLNTTHLVLAQFDKVLC